MTGYQPPVDMIDHGAQLPERTPDVVPPAAFEIHPLQLSGYTLIAGVRDGEPFLAAPGYTRPEVLAALQSIIDALEDLT